MTNQEALIKVFEKAYKNGWANKLSHYKPQTLLRCKRYGVAWHETQLIKAELFSEEFAKAFWGENYTYIHNTDFITKEGMIHKFDKKGNIINSIELGNLEEWKYHLQQMVLEKEPVEYLKKFI